MQSSEKFCVKPHDTCAIPPPGYRLPHHWTDRIQPIAEATEQESLIKLSEDVKAKRLEEQQLTQSLNQLQNLRSQLENRGEK